MPKPILYNPSLKLQRNKRRYRSQVAYVRTTTLGNASNRVVGTKIGYVYVRDIGSSDVNGNVTYGALYQLPVKPGAVLDMRPKREVYVQTLDNQEYITGMVFDDLAQSGADPLQFNFADPRNRPILIEWLQNLQAYPDGNGTIQVMPGRYRKSDGTYKNFAGQSGIDIITGNTPSVDMQVVICQWINTITDTLTYTVSSEVSADTNLKLNPSTAETYINECANAAPKNAIGITAWIIDYLTTSISVTNKFWDLRGIIGSGGGGAVTQTISSTYTVTTDMDFIAPVEITGSITISTGSMVIL